ncbi:MAG TPA: hypothetical protein VMF89_37400 [Polyangiales bacterium]|nr:hypothetical protein [Polyangiales bacterium]
MNHAVLHASASHSRTEVLRAMFLLQGMATIAEIARRLECTVG